MMNPGFIPNDDAIQEGITLMVAPLQKIGADVLEVALMPSRHMQILIAVPLPTSVSMQSEDNKDVYIYSSCHFVRCIRKTAKSD
jgi:hypothetical protein